MAARNNWKRVSRTDPCAVCGKPDWCVMSCDGASAICCRVPSDRRNSAGWFHKLTDVEPPRWRKVRRSTSKYRDYTAFASKLERQCIYHDCLAAELGVSVDSLKRLHLGWNAERRAYAFPMVRNDGSVSGICYRDLNTGAKYCESGSREGLFADLGYLNGKCLIVCEGASDTAAVLTLGFESVVGRRSCNSNVGQIINLVRRLSILKVLVLADNDRVGLQGANELAAQVKVGAVISMPREIKDVRECIGDDLSRQWLHTELEQRGAV